MCGRYSLDPDVAEIKRILAEIEQKTGNYKTGEIFPTNCAPVLLAQAEGIRVDAYRWGFPGFGGKGSIINARSETAADKPLFRRALESRRLAIPTTGFYEWKQKSKYLFYTPGKEVLYLGGIYSVFDGEPRFTILTTTANDSVAPYHDRMPVLLCSNEIPAWIHDTAYALAVIHRIQPEVAVRPA